ncbi:hypothetical protein TNCT_506191, partial [Trichonephila clavata]
KKCQIQFCPIQEVLEASDSPAATGSKPDSGFECSLQSDAARKRHGHFVSDQCRGVWE